MSRDPYDFDVTRQNNGHVTFADIRVAGEVPCVRSNFVNGVKRLPVEVTPARLGGPGGPAP